MVRLLLKTAYATLALLVIVLLGLSAHKVVTTWQHDTALREGFRALKSHQTLRIVSTEDRLSSHILGAQSSLDYQVVVSLAKWLRVDFNVSIVPDADALFEALMKDRADLAVGIPQKLVDPGTWLGSEIYGQQNIHIVRRQAPPVQTLDQITDAPIIVNNADITSQALLLNPQVQNQSALIKTTTAPLLQALRDMDATQPSYALLKRSDYLIYRNVIPNLNESGVLDTLNLQIVASPEKSGLMEEVNRFLSQAQNEGSLALWASDADYYLGEANTFTVYKFQHHMRNRLRQYQDVFEDAAKENDLNWRFLAAVSYQESHWQANARSPTDVKGIMMLTLPTARLLGVKNRLNPKQSIHGGARYLRWLHDQFSEVAAHERLWFAAASYNLGLGHILDAQNLSAQFGWDPQDWRHVRRTLPLLTDEHWHSQTRHGYARGHETVVYVRNVRRYYDALLQLARE